MTTLFFSYAAYIFTFALAPNTFPSETSFFPLSSSLSSIPHFLFSTQQSDYKPENACQNNFFFLLQFTLK